MYTHLACMHSHDWASTPGFGHLLLPFLAHATVVLQSAGTAAGRHQIGFHLKTLRHDKLVQAMEILQQTLLCLLTQCLSPQWFYDRILIKARSPYQEAVAAAVAAACY